MVKGLGYSIEALVAILVLLLFSLGAIEVSGPEQDWNNYQREVAAHDLTYALEESGYTEEFLRRGETGTIQTVMTTISDRDMEVSGFVSQIPVFEFSVSYFATNNERFDVDLANVQSSDPCYGDLGEIQDFSSEPILKTDGSLESRYGVTLYFGNTNSTSSSTRPGYDALWVDNGTSCQFAADEGPYYLDEIFFWGDRSTATESDYHDFKSIEWDDSTSSGSSTFFNATQPVRLTDPMTPGPNNISTDVSIDMVNISDLGSEDYDLNVFRTEDSLPQAVSNTDLMENLIEEGSVMLLMDISQSDINNYRFLDKTGISWIDLNYEGTYTGGEANASFSSEDASIELNTNYEGLRGSDEFKLSPPGKVVSNTSGDIRPSRTIYSTDRRYDSSGWQRNSSTLTNITNPSTVPSRPNSQCYNNFDESTEYPLSRETINFPGGEQVGVLSAKLGENNQACDNLIERGLKFDFNNDGNYESDLYLNGETVRISGIEYFIESNKNPSTNPGCGYWGECVNFIPSIRGSDDYVQLMVVRDKFQNMTGKRFALTGYQESYKIDQRKAIASTMFWLVQSDQNFEGTSEPGSIDSRSFGSVDGPAYLPYRLNLRWSE